MHDSELIISICDVDMPLVKDSQTLIATRAESTSSPVDRLMSLFCISCKQTGTVVPSRFVTLSVSFSAQVVICEMFQVYL